MTDNSEQSKGDVRDFKAPVDFDSLEITSIDPFGPAGEVTKLKYEISIPVLIDGKVFTMLFQVEKSDKEKSRTNLKWEEVKFFILNKEVALLECDLEFDFPVNEGEAMKVWDSIERHDDSTGDLPAGVGMKLYKKVLDFIEKQVGVYQLDILHEVKHDEDLGLSEEAWTEKFGPVLKDKQYELLSQGGEGKHLTWGRLYHFEK